MKKLLFLLLLISSYQIFGQDIDYYGPEPFNEILGNSFNKSWTPATITAIENRKYIVLLDQATISTAVMLDGSDISTIRVNPIDSINGSSSTYSSVMRSIFQIVDINTHLDNRVVPLAGEYRITPILHSYFDLNSTSFGLSHWSAPLLEIGCY